MTTTKEIHASSTIIWDKIRANMERCWLAIKWIMARITATNKRQQESLKQTQDEDIQIDTRVDGMHNDTDDS